MDEVLSLPPFLPLFIGGLLIAFLPLYGRRALLIAAPLASLMSVFGLSAESIFPINIVGTTVHLLATQEYSLVFGLAFCFAIIAAVLFGFRHARPKEMGAAMVLASGGLGIVFSGDLLSLLFFWEILMAASVYLIYLGGMAQSVSSSRRYLIMHILGGTFLLAGIAGTIMDSGIAAFPSFQLGWHWPQTSTEWSAWLMLLGVMVNLAAPPFSAWLPDSYPAASPFGMVALSAFTTKSAVFVLMMIFAGSAPLIAIGLFTLLYATLMALMQSHLRRHLAYCIVAQVGVMVMGVGIGTEAALTAVAILAFCHIGYKGLLIAAAGSIIHQTGKYRMGDLGGLWRQMPVTAGAIILGAASMAALPITGAFVGKHLLVESLIALGQPFYKWFFVGIAGIAVYLLFPWFSLSGKSKNPQAKEVPIETQLCYGIFGFMALAPGLYPDFLSFLMPGRPDIAMSDAAAIFNQLTMIVCACGAFLLLLPWLKRDKGLILDFDWLYRVLLPHLLTLINQLYKAAESRAASLLRIFNAANKQWLTRFFAEGGSLTRPQSIGISTTIASGLLLVFLLLFYR